MTTLKQSLLVLFFVLLVAVALFWGITRDLEEQNRLGQPDVVYDVGTVTMDFASRQSDGTYVRRFYDNEAGVLIYQSAHGVAVIPVDKTRMDR